MHTRTAQLFVCIAVWDEEEDAAAVEEPYRLPKHRDRINSVIAMEQN